MKRTNVYVDGYNLYYGLLKGTPDKWLDLSCLVRSLLAPDHEIGTIYYFTSIITPYPHDAAAATFYRSIPRDLPARCQFPDEILTGKKGKVIRRPSGW